MLAPSQTIRTATASNQSSGNRSNNHRGVGSNGPGTEDAPRPNRGRLRRGPPKPPPGESKDVTEKTETNEQKKPYPKKNNRRRKKKPGPKPTASSESKDNVEEKPPAVKPLNTANNDGEKKLKAKRKRNKKKSFPWRKHIPKDSVDPITLEPLVALRYPPFAMVAAPPYEAVPEWPIPEPKQEQESEQAESVAPNTELREQQILAEQWGSQLPVPAAACGKTGNDNGDDQHKSAVEDEVNPSAPAPQQRHYHLYDGQALACWMTASNQFIDPLNRRDVLREELVHLDKYLRRHGLATSNSEKRSLSVTAAYDAKGITISTAGEQGNTAAGRAVIRQQEATGLLQSLFGRTPPGPSAPSRDGDRPTAGPNMLMSQYQAYEASSAQQQQQRNRNNRSRNNNQSSEVDTGIYGGMGMLIIDDDMNPGLRGNATEFVPSSADQAPTTNDDLGSLWSASHIASRYSHAARLHDHDFPSLTGNSPTPAPAPAAAEKKRVLPKVRTLSKIATAVKKTDPEEVQRQWEAREEARQKAMMRMAMMNPGANTGPPASIITPTLLSSSFTDQAAESTASQQGQLDRNRAFAEALGVAPSNIRQQAQSLTSGWTRPVSAADFGAELQTVIYPDQLIESAKESMEVILKVERRWKAFLLDDTSASSSLPKMDRESRTLVHHYSDFWRLETQSYDPEPKRYIHCTKLRDTGAPSPLLSQAVKNWKGPQQLPLPVMSSGNTPKPAPVESDDQQQANRNFSEPAEGRVPLSLKPRSGTPTANAVSTTGLPIGGAPTRTMMNDTENNERFSLSNDEERPKLVLQKRTLPTELPPYEQSFDVSQVGRIQKDRRAAQAEKERAKQLEEQRILEQAFASDDESDSKLPSTKINDDDDDSWGDAQEPVFQGDDA